MKTNNKIMLILCAACLLMSGCGNKGGEKTTAANEKISDAASSEDGAAVSADATAVSAPEDQSPAADTASITPDDMPYDIEGTYLGVENYGAPEANKDTKDSFRYRFLINGEEQSLTINNTEVDADGFFTYPVQNHLKEGYDYGIKTENGAVTDVTELDRGDSPAFTPPVSGTPGEKTVLNFLKTALMPAGTALYIYGGGWDWQDSGSSVQATSLGVSPDWVRFFNNQTADYNYKAEDPAASFYPFGGYNEYYYAGLDCSGFLGWALYNTFETENGQLGYVGPSSGFAKRLSEMGFGSFDKEKSLKPGDIVNIKGHVYISLGSCSDGSALIVHSTPAKSRNGFPGGGVELSAIGSSSDCEAYGLAKNYMSEYCPDWYSRYDIVLADPGTYFAFEDESSGRFTWGSGSEYGLQDPEGIREMTPAAVLSAITE